MKNKFKFLIASVSFAILLFSSCEKEIYDEAIYKTKQPQNLNISKISFKELKSNKNAIEKIKSVITKKFPSSIANRAIFNEDLGILLDTTNIVQITSATEKSITFNIVDYTNTAKKENLVLISKNEGDFKAYIAEYYLTQQDLNVLANGGIIQNIKPISISEIEDTSKVAISGDCVSSYTYSYWACYNSNGNVIPNNGELGNNCVGLGFEFEMQIITIDMACLSGGSGGGTSGTSGTSGANGTGSTGSGPTGGSTSTGSNNPNPNQSILDLFNTTFVPCTSCLEFNQTLSNFLEGLTPEQLEYWNDLEPRTQQNIVDYIEANNNSSESINFIKESFLIKYTEMENFAQINPNDITYDSPLTSQNLPSLSNFLNNFPKNGSSGNFSQMPASDVYNLVGGSLLNSFNQSPGNYANACSIRGSRGLLYSGINIPVLNYNGSQRTQKGGDLRNYILDAVSFNKFMIDKFGDTPNKLEGAAANNPHQVKNLLEGKNGIYVIINNNPSLTTGAGYSGHVDLILNGNCIGNEYLGPKGGVKSIRIWILN